MKKLLLLLLLVIKLDAFAQKGNSLLWEISGKGLKSPSYIFGTYHLITSTFTDSFPEIRNTVKKCGTVAGELVIDSSLTMKVTKAAIMQDSSLEQLLSPEDYKLVDAYLKEVSGMSLMLFNKMKPVMVNTLLYTVLLPKDDKGTAMDIYFQNLAKEWGMPVRGLETVDDQIQVLFNSVSLKRQAELLVQSVRNKDKNIKEMMKMNHCYREMDMACLGESLKVEDGYSDEELKVLLDSRNKRWLEKIPAMMTEGPVFFAVGAGHLPGPYGLLKQLELLGYTVKPVKIK